MNVVQFPRPVNEPRLIATAPQAYVRNDPWMGLTEAIAWVGSRDKRFSDAVYWQLHEREDRSRSDMAGLWFVMRDDLEERYGAVIAEAEAEVMASGLMAVGRFQGGGFEPMDALRWVDVQIALDDVPDAITPRDIRNNLGKPQWSHIRFKRDDVLALWPVPVPDEPKVAKPAHPSSLAEKDAPLLTEMRAAIEAGQASGPYAAALLFVDRAAGGGNTESKVRRLERRYGEKFPE